MATDNTQVDFDAVATEIRSALETVVGKIPQFNFPAPSKGRIHALKSVPPDFIHDLVETVDSTDVGLNKVFDTAEARMLMTFYNAFQPIVALSKQVSAVLDYSVQSAFTHVASDALDAYAITSRVALRNDETMNVKAQSARRALMKRYPGHRRSTASDTPTTSNPQ